MLRLTRVMDIANRYMTDLHGEKIHSRQIKAALHGIVTAINDEQLKALDARACVLELAETMHTYLTKFNDCAETRDRLARLIAAMSGKTQEQIAPSEQKESIANSVPKLNPDEAPEGYYAELATNSESCNNCAFRNRSCLNLSCRPSEREDGCSVFFRKKEELKKERPMVDPLEAPDGYYAVAMDGCDGCELDDCRKADCHWRDRADRRSVIFKKKIGVRKDDYNIVFRASHNTGSLQCPFLLVERFADNGEHSHWELIERSTGVVEWSQQAGA